MTLESSSGAIEAEKVDPQAKYSIYIKGFEAAGRSFTYSVYSRMSPRGMAQLGGQATAYICIGQTCSLPQTKTADLRTALNMVTKTSHPVR